MKKPFVLVHLSKLLTLNDHLFKTKYIKWHIACISRLSHFKVACFVEKRSFSIDCLVCFYLKLSLQLDYHFKRYPNIKNISFNWYCNQNKTHPVFQTTFITCALWIDACCNSFAGSIWENTSTILLLSIFFKKKRWNYSFSDLVKPVRCSFKENMLKRLVIAITCTS